VLKLGPLLVKAGIVSGDSGKTVSSPPKQSAPPTPEQLKVLEALSCLKPLVEEKGSSSALTSPTVKCKECGSLFYSIRGRVICGDCSPEETVERKRGHMVWLHKTAPVFQFDENPTLSPEEMEKGRRR
jgi:hypothetical protein